MKNGPPDKGGPGKAQSKPHEKIICAKSSPPASTKSPRRLPPEILSAVARSGRRPITLARPKAPKEAQPATPAPSAKPSRLSLANLKAAARDRQGALWWTP
jgi:hypothetical protein